MKIHSVTFIQTPRALQSEQPIQAVRDKKPNDLMPVRRVLGFRGQTHRPGFYFFRTLDTLIPYESRLERACLLVWDYRGIVRQVVHQPLFLHFDSKKPNIGHIPDYFFLLEGSTKMLIDVKPSKFLDRERVLISTQLTEQFCHELGWAYVLESEPNPILLGNLGLLHAFGRKPYRFDDYFEPLVMACMDGEWPLGDLVRSVRGSPVLVKPILLYLLWKRVLCVDLEQPLEDTSLVNLMAPGDANQLLGEAL